MAPLLRRAPLWISFLLGALTALSLHQCFVHGGEVAGAPASKTEQLERSSTSAPGDEGSAATEPVNEPDPSVHNAVVGSDELESYVTVANKDLRNTWRSRLRAERQRLQQYVELIPPPFLAAASVLLAFTILAQGALYISARSRRNSNIWAAAVGSSLLNKAGTLSIALRIGLPILSVIVLLGFLWFQMVFSRRAVAGNKIAGVGKMGKGTAAAANP